jgi:hypothetical protein
MRLTASMEELFSSGTAGSRIGGEMPLSGGDGGKPLLRIFDKRPII